MGNMTGNCTDTKAGITVKTVFGGKQSLTENRADSRHL